MYAAPWRGATGQPAFYRQIAHSGAEYIREVQDRYAPTPFPVHLIWGDHDDNIPVEQGRELARLLATESFTTVNEAAHIVMEDAPEAVLRRCWVPVTSGWVEWSGRGYRHHA